MCTYYKNELIFQISWTDWFCCVNICIIFSNMKNYGAIFSVLWGERGPVIYCQWFPIRDVCFVCTEQQSDRCVPYIFISSVCPHFHFRLPSMLSVTTCTYCVTPPASLIAFLSSSCCFMIYCSPAVIYHFTSSGSRLEPEHHTKIGNTTGLWSWEHQILKLRYVKVPKNKKGSQLCLCRRYELIIE